MILSRLISIRQISHFIFSPFLGKWKSEIDGTDETDDTDETDEYNYFTFSSTFYQPTNQQQQNKKMNSNIHIYRFHRFHRFQQY